MTKIKIHQISSGEATVGQVPTADGAGNADWEEPAGGAVDAADVTYTPAVATDWNGDADPGNADDAFDQLAERVDDLEGGSGHAAVTLDADAAAILDLSTQEIGLDVQNANTVLAGPTTGAANEPTFRALVAADVGTETPNGAKFLRDDMSWQTPAGGGDVATDPIWDAKGDLAVGTGANTAAKLTVGAANTFPMADAGETTGLKWGIAPYHLCQGRITLTSGTPVTTADVTGATSIYFTPYKGDQIGLFDGTYWDILAFAELTLSLAGYTASKPYDIFAYNNSGAVALESLVWTDATTRATALVYQNGILVKSGTTTRRYLGTIYINSSGGQTDDSNTKRFVWNYYNQKDRQIKRTESTAHTYNSSTPREWNNNAAIRVYFVLGLIEEPIYGFFTCRIYNTAVCGFALNRTNDYSANSITPYNGSSSAAQWNVGGSTSLDITHLNVGYNYLTVCEDNGGGGTSNFITFRHVAIIMG